MKPQRRFYSGLWIFLATFLIAALPVSTAFAQLAEPDGISDGVTTPPHDRPLNFYSPCSQCHVRMDQWAQSKFEFKKLAIESAEDFKAVRDLQYQLAKKMAVRCEGSCGHPKNYQMHPPRDQACTLCHADKFQEKHETIDMTINEFQPVATCGLADCHKEGPGDLTTLGKKIPYWSMSFVGVNEMGGAGALNALMDRTQLASPMVFPFPAITPLDKAEGKWKHEIKNRIGFIISEDVAEIGEILGSNLTALVELAYADPIPGSLEGKVEVKSEVSNDAMQEYFLGFEKDLEILSELLKETKLESKFKPPLPAEAWEFIKVEIPKRFKGAVVKEEKDDKLVWTMDMAGIKAEIKVEFKGEETKLKFSVFPPKPSKGLFDALKALDSIEKEYPGAILWESKFAHTYKGEGEDRWLVAKTISDYVADLPDKDVKYEIKGVKDTETVLEVAALLPLKVDQYPGEDTLELKTELKVKFEKPGEPEVKSEVVIAEAETE